MKKLISLLAALAVVSTASVAFASETDNYGTITVPENTAKLEATDGSYTVNVSTSDQGTILAVQGTSIKVGSIQYINQATASNGSASFNFKLNDSRIAKTDGVANDDVYVLTGDGKVKVIDLTPEASTGYTISGSVTNAPSQSFITDELTEYVKEIYGEEEVDNYISEYTITASLISENEAENFVNWALGEADSFTALKTASVSFEDGSYSFKDVEDGTYILALTSNSALTWADYVTVDGGNVTVDSVTLIYGDVIGQKDAIIGSGDVGAVLANMCDIESESFVCGYDVSPDCIIGSGDVGTVLANMGDISAYGTDFINDNF